MALVIDGHYVNPGDTPPPGINYTVLSDGYDVMIYVTKNSTIVQCVFGSECTSITRLFAVTGTCMYNVTLHQ